MLHFCFCYLWFCDNSFPFQGVKDSRSTVPSKFIPNTMFSMNFSFWIAMTPGDYQMLLSWMIPMFSINAFFADRDDPRRLPNAACWTGVFVSGAGIHVFSNAGNLCSSFLQLLLPHHLTNSSILNVKFGSPSLGERFFVAFLGGGENFPWHDWGVIQCLLISC